jgi:hypothetical protein
MTISNEKQRFADDEILLANFAAIMETGATVAACGRIASGRRSKEPNHGTETPPWCRSNET